MERLPSFKDWFVDSRADIDAVVFDIDGVLMLGRSAAGGAAELLAILREDNCPYGLLTNDAHHSIKERVERMRGCGLDIKEDEITSCGHGLVEFVEQRTLVGTLFFVMGRLGAPCYAELAGLRVTRDIADLPKCAGVVIGERGFSWEHEINAAINYFVRNPNGLLVLPNPDEFFMGDAGLVEMASGAPAYLISHICGLLHVDVTLITLGKPHEPIFLHNHHALEARLGNISLKRERVVMVGDSLRADIAGARNFGYRTALMMTGITTEAALAATTNPPDYVFARL